MARRPYLIVGPSGTGKTTLALQFLIEGIRRGERGLLVTMEEPPNEIRINHRLLGPELLQVEVFDAIPDIMRFERVPFKDIAAVRQASPFGKVPLEIRRSPELTAVEVTMTALEQMLRGEVQRRTYSRIAIDSLTAFQYFCMKGFDLVAGAQAFLRFLSDLRVTTILTLESPLEDVETPERMLARGEVRLFRWELDGRTVRAIGVEKFRGSSHDVRLHPYRIGPQGLDVNLQVTISRDTRQIIEAARAVEVARAVEIAPEVPAVPEEAKEVISPADPLAEEVQDLVLVGAEVAPLRTEIEAALRAAAEGDAVRAQARLSRAHALVIGLSGSLADGMKEAVPSDPKVAEAFQRIVQRSEAARAGMPPTELPPPKLLEVQLEWVLSLLPEAPPMPAEPAADVPGSVVPPTPEPLTVPEEASVEPAPELVPAPAAELEAGEATEVPSEPLPEAVDSETLSSSPRPEPAEEAVRAPEALSGSSEAVPSEPEPATATPALAPEPAVVADPVPPEVPDETPPVAPVSAEAVPETEVGGPRPSDAPTLPAEPGPETVEEVLAPPEVAHVLSSAGEAPAEPAEPSEASEPAAPAPIAPGPSLPSGPGSQAEVEIRRPTASEEAPAPRLESLPPPPARNAEPPVRPLRAWTPPALPTATRRPAPVARVEVAATSPPVPRAPPPPAPVTVHKARPPLPTSIGEPPSQPEGRIPLDTSPPVSPARPAAASAPAPASSVHEPPSAVSPPAPPAAVPPGPAAHEPVPPVAVTPPKRKRKPRSAPARRKTAASVSPVVGSLPSSVAGGKDEAAPLTGAPVGPVIEAAPPPKPRKPKRRPARKRKAPPVVAAHPGPAPSGESGAATNTAPPPLPTPSPPPPEETSSAEERP